MMPLYISAFHLGRLQSVTKTNVLCSWEGAWWLQKGLDLKTSFGRVLREKVPLMLTGVLGKGFRWASMGCRYSHSSHSVEGVRERKITPLARSASTWLELCPVGWTGVGPGASRLQWKVWSGRLAEAGVQSLWQLALWTGSGWESFMELCRMGCVHCKESRPEKEAWSMLEKRVSSRQGQEL